ncbi:MAG: lipoate--protein ligase family protein [Burkholderiaceae bacterium]|jgi:lipoate-protein ligase A|nr:MAG: lipoate--protein ligase family protein [Burkholderiaceae bacterium]
MAQVPLDDMTFTLLHDSAIVPDPIAVDTRLMQRASSPVAQIWGTSRALVMPRAYSRYPNVDAVRGRLAARGLPVYVRASGGGLVPQGPGILNVSLAYPLPGPVGHWVEPIYRHLCALLSLALAPFGIDARPAAVTGSFCDGRFNLAHGRGTDVRKIAGTAQYWRLNAARDSGYTVLAHALLLVQPDLAAIHRDLNAFEHAIHSGRSYDAGKTTSVAQLTAVDSAGDLMQRVRGNLSTAIERAEPPRITCASN